MGVNEMKRIILFIVFLLLVSFVSATDVSIDISSNEAIDGYFTLNSPNNNVWIDGVGYKDYVDERSRGDYTNRDLSRVFRETAEYIIGTRTIYKTNGYHRDLADALVSLMNHLTGTIYNNWILPIQL